MKVNKLQDLDKYINSEVKYAIINDDEWRKLRTGNIKLCHVDNVACEGFEYRNCLIVSGGAFPSPQAIIDCRGRRPIITNSVRIIPSKLPELRQKIGQIKKIATIEELVGFLSNYPIVYIFLNEKEYNRLYNLYTGEDFGLFTVGYGTYQGFKIGKTAILNGDKNKTLSYILYANNETPHLKEIRSMREVFPPTIGDS